MSLRSQAAKLVDRLRNDVRGTAILADWLGSGGDPVDHVTANGRAAICSGCPNNKPLTKRIENNVAEAIRKQEEIRHAVELRTSHDGNLHNCSICSCYLKLKVWVPIKHIPKDDKFPAFCWIRKEHATPIPPAPVPVAEPAAAEPARPSIRVRRENAFGDTIQATILATKLWERGYDVWWRCADAVRPALLHHPHIAGFLTDRDGQVDVDLDKTYEGNIERTRKDLATLFLEASDHQLRSIRVAAVDHANRVPHLALTEAEVDTMRARCKFAGKLVAFVPRSGFWPSRTIDSDSLAQASALIKGTAVWAFQGSAPKGRFHELGIKTFRELMALIYCADVVVTPDTGPLHVAAAFNKPIVLVEQAIAGTLRLSYQTDWTAVHAPLDCIRCGDFTCHIDKDKPPCQKVPPELIADAVNKKLAALDGDTVSAIIPVYKNHPRLKRCLDAAAPQCHQMVVALDGDTKWHKTAEYSAPSFIESPGTRTGFGKTCMRGAHASTGSFLLFLNDDCYMKPGCVQAMLDTMKKHPKCAVVGAQLWYPDGTLQHGGTMRMNGDVGFGHRDWKRRTASLQGEHEMEFVTFACALVRRSAFYGVRGFDEDFDTYCEDSDLCIRLRQAGWQVFYNADAKAIHDESQTTAPMKAQLHQAAQKIFVRKHQRYFQHNPV